jgi:ABC-type anion transport system duplicated permease subunit
VRISLTTLIWLAVGVLLSASHHYLERVETVREIVSAFLAIVLWPLLLLGINLHIH